ncbi:MAG: hypothetical protein OSA98_12395 [Rubripirellula sp.]|nr:hypothetical protein [Rubripirellula sp.]
MRIGNVNRCLISGKRRGICDNADDLPYKTRNDFHGVQVGITSIPDLPLLDCRSLRWSAKGGLYGNDSEQKSILNGTVGQRSDAPANSAAFIAGFNVGLELPVTDCLTISGGYGLLIMERVAIASDR